MKRPIAIVLNWNSPDDTLKCVQSLIAQTTQPDILIIDNDSHDDSVEQFKAYQAKTPNAPITLIENDANLGFTGGVNIGLNYAIENNYDYACLLNPDAVADKNWCRELLTEMNTDPSVGITTGLMLRADGKTIDTSGDIYTNWGLPGPRGRDEPAENAPTKSDYIFGATGGGVMLKVAALKQIGLLDDDFFMYYEDIDISFRAQLGGWKARYNPKAIAHHKVNASSNKVPGLAVYNTFKNLPLVFIKNMPSRLFWRYVWRFNLMYLLIFASAVRHGNGWPALKGVFASLAKQPKAWKKRRQIQKSRRASLDYIDSIIHKGPLPNQTGLIKFVSIFKKRAS